MCVNVQHKLQYTFGGRFSVLGYYYPNMGINQSESAYEACYFITLNEVKNSVTIPLKSWNERHYNASLPGSGGLSANSDLKRGFPVFKEILFSQENIYDYDQPL